jgi:hypothetical protein
MKLNKQKALIIFLAIIAVCGLAYEITNLSMQYRFNSEYKLTKQEQAAAVPEKILLVWNRGAGEKETIQRLKITCANLGINFRVVTSNRNAPIRKYIADPVQQAVKIFQPDFILSIQDHTRYYPGIPNYKTLTFGTERYIATNSEGRTHILIPEILKFDAVLPSFKDIDLLQEIYERRGKKFIGFPWYPSVYETSYAPAIPNKLFYSGGNRWDSTRNSEKYATVYQQLDKAGYFIVSGHKDKWLDVPNSAIGYVENDGKSLIAAIHDAGVALVLHHTLHLNGGAPTSRIFEAAAANAVIISDRHPFVVQHFGDNVLYVDIDQDADQMFQQIDAHMQWILAHPAQAQQMANNCHAINNANFSLEILLNRLLTMHRQYMQVYDKQVTNETNT